MERSIRRQNIYYFLKLGTILPLARFLLYCDAKCDIYISVSLKKNLKYIWTIKKSILPKA